MKPFLATAALTLALGLNLAPAWAFDFNDLETVERAEQGELLERARQAAGKGRGVLYLAQSTRPENHLADPVPGTTVKVEKPDT